MLDCNFKLYAVRRINLDQKIQYWNFWIENWVDENDFDPNEDWGAKQNKTVKQICEDLFGK